MQRALLVVIWNIATTNIATTNAAYRDPGSDYFTRLTRSNAVRQLEAMGYHVTVEQAS